MIDDKLILKDIYFLMPESRRKAKQAIKGELECDNQKFNDDVEKLYVMSKRCFITRV